MIAIQGIKGSYSEEAAASIAGADAVLLECVDFEALFRALDTGLATGAVVPVRNKIIGIIDAAGRMIGSGRYRVREALKLPVEHVLAGTGDSEFASIGRAVSHPAALKQCRRFFAENARIRPEPAGDTASSILEVIRQGDRRMAAVCSQRAASIHGARILASGVADERDNWTEFYLIEKA